MTHIDIHCQLAHVLAGRSADGHPGRGVKLSAGSAREQAMVGLLLVALFRDLRALMPELLKQDRVRTALILVFVRWVRLSAMSPRQITRLLAAAGEPEFIHH